jgi:hypothetical protein
LERLLSAKNLIAQSFPGYNRGMTRRVIVIAGPNGAGKTTFAQSFLPREGDCPNFINADLIAAGLAPFKPQAAAIQAGRIMLSEMRRYLEQGDSFAFETTLSGRLEAAVDSASVGPRQIASGARRARSCRQDRSPAISTRLAELRERLSSARWSLGTLRQFRREPDTHRPGRQIVNRRSPLKPKRRPTALAALKRASKQAIELAKQTKTPAWIMEGDKLVDATKKSTKSEKKGRRA